MRLVFFFSPRYFPPSFACHHLPSDKVHRTGEKPSFSDTKKNTGDHQPSKVLDYTCAGHHNSPGDDQDSQVGRWTLELFQNHVAGNFKEDVRDEENGNTV